MPDVPSPIHTRQTDPPGYDAHARVQRQPNPALWDWEAYYGKAGIRGRNLLLAFLVFGLLMVGSVWYLFFRLEGTITQALATSNTEHSQIVESASQTNCILALTQEERTAFRNDLRPDAWSRWCWWIKREIRGGGP